MTVELQFLGKFQARKDDVNVPSIGRKSIGLLGALALAPEGQLSRTSLAGLLWGDRGEDQARDSLRQSLASIKRKFDGAAHPVIEADRELVGLNRVGVVSDVRNFAELTQTSEFATRAKAVEIFRGPFLQGLEINDNAFHDWLLRERERLNVVAASTLTSLLADASLAKNSDDRLKWADRLSEIDDFSEAAVRAKIEYYGAIDEIGKVNREFDRIRAILQRELGVEPSKDTIDTYQRVIDNQEVVVSAQVFRDSAQTGANSRSTGGDTEQDHIDRISVRGNHTGMPKIAVLPLRNLSGDPDQAYFVDGITEEIIVSLSSFRSMRVVSSQSSFSFRITDQDPITIAGTLMATYLVCGSLRRSGESVRINLELIGGKTGEILWASRFDGQMDEIFEIQDSISKSIVASIVGQIERYSVAVARRKRTEHLSAYDLYLKGNEKLHEVQKSENVQARQLYEASLTIDEDFARAHAGVALSVFDAVFMGWERTGAIEDGMSHAESAAKLDPVDSYAQLAVGMLKFLQHDFGGSEFHLQTAHNLNKSDTDIMIYFAIVLMYDGRPREALTWIDKAIELNPLHPEFYFTVLGTVLFWSGRYEEALDQYNHRQSHDQIVLAYMAAARVQAGFGVANSALTETLSGQDQAAADANKDLPALLADEVSLYRDEQDKQFLISTFVAAGLVSS